MLRLQTSLLTLCGALLIAQSASAQPAASRRRGPPAQVTPAPQPKPDDKGPICKSRQAILEREQRQLERYQAESAGINAEIDELKRRLAELERDKQQTDRTMAGLNSRIGHLEQEIKRECSSGQCDQAYTTVAALDTRSNEIEALMNQVGKDIAASRSATVGLEKRIEPLRQEYSAKRCNDLVPGETSQATIDRCAVIFSEWNRLQTDLNGQNRRLTDLRRQYQQLYNELNSIGQRAETFANLLNTQCKDPARKPHKMRDYAKVRQNAQNLGRELDDLITTVTRLRGIRISVQGN